jgi:hypothetical protein
VFGECEAAWRGMGALGMPDINMLVHDESQKQIDSILNAGGKYYIYNL